MPHRLYARALACRAGQGHTPDWPPAVVGKWVAADRHARPDGARDGFEEAAPDEGAASESTRDGKWKAFTGSSQTLQTVHFLELREKGPTLRDQQVLYADGSMRLNEASSILSESRAPAEATGMTDMFLQKVRILGDVWGEEWFFCVGFIGLPPTVRMPARSSNARKRGAAEGSRGRAAKELLQAAPIRCEKRVGKSKRGGAEGYNHVVVLCFVVSVPHLIFEVFSL